MRVCGIIAEYNPLHEGHLYHIARTRELLPDGAFLVCVLSGHAVQRGDFPILTKYARTKMALRAGFDLVFELPSVYACAPAERFARAAVEILAALGVITHLSFGAETPDTGALRAAAARPGVYPKDMTLASAMPALFPGSAGLYTPNNILAIEYLRALRDIAPHIEPLAVGRHGDAHDGGSRSAGAIRRRVMNGESPGLPFPDIWEEEVSSGRAPIFLERQQGAVLSYLRRMTAGGWERVPDTRGGLSGRLIGAVSQAGTLDELFRVAKTKRYTMARLRRCVLCAFLGITSEMPERHPPLRLLGIGKRGNELLAHIKAPLISRPAAFKEGLSFESAVTDQLTLCMPAPHPTGLEWREGVVK